MLVSCQSTGPGQKVNQENAYEHNFYIWQNIKIKNSTVPGKTFLQI